MYFLTFKAKEKDRRGEKKRRRRRKFRLRGQKTKKRTIRKGKSTSSKTKISNYKMLKYLISSFSDHKVKTAFYSIKHSSKRLLLSLNIN